MSNDKTIRAVIFDMGGVLIQTKDRTPRRKWEMRLGLQEGELSTVVFGSDVAARAMIGQTSENEVWQDVARRMRLSDEQLDNLITDFWSCDDKDHDLVRFAQSLGPRFKTAILSNAFTGARQAVSENFQFDAIFDPMIISAEVGLAKPDARIFHLTAERVGVAPHEAIFIDDMLGNVEAARAIGMCGVHFVNTAQAIAEVKQHLGMNQVASDE